MKFGLNKKNILIVVLLLLLALSIFIFTIYKKINVKDNLNQKKEIMNVKFESGIDKINSFDAGEYYKIGWLQVQGTNIDTVILDSRTANVELDYSYGWRSVSYQDGENREVLMGHNILNVSSNPMLPNELLKNFESLLAFTYAGFAKENLYIQYTKNGVDELYAIYAIGFHDYEYDRAESFSKQDDVKKYIEKARENSIYNYDIEVNENDQIITLKTCTRYFGLFEKQEFYIEARKVRENEKTYKYSVNTNSNFDKLISNNYAE